MNEIEQKLEKLPILSEKVTQLINLKNEDSFDSKKLLIIIENDATLVRRILTLSNSKYFGFLHKVYTPSRALGLLGVNFVISICIVELVLNAIKFNLLAYKINYEKFSLLIDLSLKILFELVEDEDIEIKENLIVPLCLQHISRFIFSDILERNGNLSSFSAILSNVNTLKAEKDFFEIDSFELSSRILKKWAFPSFDIEILSSVSKNIYLPKYKKEQEALKVINYICDIKQPFEELNIKYAIKCANEYDFDVLKLKKVINEFKNDF